MPTPWPLVGRAAELADIADAMDLGAGGVLFADPAGVGKTRLATEPVDEAAQGAGHQLGGRVGVEVRDLDPLEELVLPERRHGGGGAPGDDA